MARAAKREKHKIREQLILKKGPEREKLKKEIKKSLDVKKREELQLKLAKLPRDTSKVRLTNPCRQCGRARGTLRKFGLCRICVRIHLNAANIPGLRKASW